MEKKLKIGEKTMADMVTVTFGSPQAKDDFLRKLVAAKTKDEIASLMIGDADQSRVN